MPDASKPCIRRTSARSRRDALYSALEAAVREDFNGEIHGKGKVISVRDGGIGIASNVDDVPMATKTYPFPILWYEEMTPSDLDAYHAAHHHQPPGYLTDGCVADSHDYELRRSHQLGSREDPHPNWGELLRKGGSAYSAEELTVKVGQAQTLDAEGSGTPNPSPQRSSSSYIPQPPHIAEQNVPVPGNSASPVEEEKESNAWLGKSTVVWTSQARSTASPTEGTTTATGVMGSEPVSGGRKRARTVSEAFAAATEKENETRRQESTFRPISLAVNSSNTGAASWRHSFPGYPSQSAVDGKEAEEVSEAMRAPDSNESRFGGGKELASTSARPPESSQGVLPATGTQTMFLPGLPSQLLVTQDDDDSAFYNHSQYNQGEPEGEGEWLGSAHDLSRQPSAPTKSTVYRISSERHGVRSRQEADKTTGSGSGGVVSCARDAGNSGYFTDRTLDRKADRAQRCDEFVRALEAFVVGTEGKIADAGDGPGAVNVECGHGRGNFDLVSTEDFLSRAWVGGQAGVVATLESHLSRARDRAPDGYIVRALELARHVLSRPRVCVRVGVGRGDIAGRSLPQRFGLSETAPCVPEGNVVGVAGLVWEILRVERGVVQGPPASDDAQSSRNT